ncbi:hypothetical protein Y1Q_0002154 [Alligator mississippiensis]|uniref:Uncharacterized protein n=1 Tax=Alligator mississippiensis TaxID=8496 RepID=A0A151MPQ3_ALLMI|nr:hypothetical protein Y1Q_0002154 [Alligator mississippiensis]
MAGRPDQVQRGGVVSPRMDSTNTRLMGKSNIIIENRNLLASLLNSAAFSKLPIVAADFTLKHQCESTGLIYCAFPGVDEMPQPLKSKSSVLPAGCASPDPFPCGTVHQWC